MDHRVYDDSKDLITHEVAQEIEMQFDEEVKVDG